MTSAGTDCDYHGVLVVVETASGEIVFIHPPGAPEEAPASLPSNPAQPNEELEAAAARVVRELTGLEVHIVEEFTTFVQRGTPTGVMLAHGYVARVTGGTLRRDGPEGPADVYPVERLPEVVPIRAANQRVLRDYLATRSQRPQ